MANTAAIKKYDGLKHSGDEADALHLAHLLRLGILPEGHVCPPAERAVRDLARKRMQLTRCRTQQILAIENILARQTGATITSNQIKQLEEDGVERLGLPVDVALALRANLAVARLFFSDGINSEKNSTLAPFHCYPSLYICKKQLTTSF